MSEPEARCARPDAGAATDHAAALRGLARDYETWGHKAKAEMLNGAADEIERLKAERVTHNQIMAALSADNVKLRKAAG